MNKKTILLAAFAALPIFSMQVHAQRVKAANDVIDCGQVAYRQPVTSEFELKNDSNRPLTISNVDTGCGCLVADYPHGEIGAKDKFTVRVTYDAAQMGHFEKMIDVYCHGDEAPFTLWIKGMVVREVVDFVGNYPFKLGTLMADKNNIEFDDVNSGDRQQQKIHIRNVGSEAAQPVVMHLPNYLQADVSPSKIAPGRSGVVTITLDSRSLDDLGLTQTRVYLGSRPGEKVSSDKEVTVSAVLLPKVSSMSAAARAASPKMSLSAQELNFGEFNGKGKQKGEITITNQGRTDLRIDNMQVFTSGVNISLNKQTIPPGETVKLKVTIDKRQLRAARSEPRILMITNDPDNPKIVINIRVAGLEKGSSR